MKTYNLFFFSLLSLVCTPFCINAGKAALAHGSEWEFNKIGHSFCYLHLHKNTHTEVVVEPDIGFLPLAETFQTNPADIRNLLQRILNLTELEGLDFGIGERNITRQAQATHLWIRNRADHNDQIFLELDKLLDEEKKILAFKQLAQCLERCPVKISFMEKVLLSTRIKKVHTQQDREEYIKNLKEAL